MRIITITTIILGLFLHSFCYADVYVKPYIRSNGTIVQGHFRSDPDSSTSNNWSHQGNINPYTGQEGHKTNEPKTPSGNYQSKNYTPDIYYYSPANDFSNNDVNDLDLYINSVKNNNDDLLLYDATLDDDLSLDDTQSDLDITDHHNNLDDNYISSIPINNNENKTHNGLTTFGQEFEAKTANHPTATPDDIKKVQDKKAQESISTIPNE